jgi:ABC-type transport system involved in multi-copper enzyme maturation permease subunit
MSSVFYLTLRQLSGKWRLLILTVLASLPVVIALLMVSSTGAATVQEFEDGVLSGILAGAISPLVVLAIASAAFANELEDRTLANLTLSPIPRWQIAVPKLLAAISVAGPFMAISGFFTGYIAFSADLNAAVAVAASATIGVVLYSSAFIWLGLKTAWVIGYGLLYIVLWEGFFSGFVSGVRLLSVRYYSIAWMHGFDERRFVEADDVSLGFAIVASIVVFAGFLLLTIRRLRNMDVP